MSLFSALYTGASGMLAQSRSTQFISNNIANSTTTGYKRSEARFSDLLSQDVSRHTSKTATVGGAMAHSVLRASEQGAVQRTSSATDLAISGNGFFIVNQTEDGAGEFVYTRAGQFSEDASGILKNTAGYTLYGHLTDANGVAQGSDMGSLVPVDISLYPQQYFETTHISSAINLDSSEDTINSQFLSPASQLPVGDATSPQYSRSITVYDQNGVAQELSLEFRHITGPTAHFTSDTSDALSLTDSLVNNPAGPTTGITNGDIFQITDGTNTLDINFVNTVANTAQNEANTLADVVNIINNYTGSGTTPLFTASLDKNNRLLVQSNDPSATLDITGSSANVLGTDGFDFVLDPDTSDYSYEPDYDITTGASGAYPGQGDFPAFGSTSDTNPFGWWEATVAHIDSATGTKTTVTQGLMNFYGDGRLNSVSGAGSQGDDILTLSAADLPFATTGDITMDVTRLTQYNGLYQTIALTQDGAPETALKNVIIDDTGLVSIQFESNLTRPVYRIPLATFDNPDGLTSINGTAFRVSAESGEPTLNEARSGGAGSMIASARENANVDLNAEFGNLIVTQRAYSMNSQIVQAANEMTQQTAQLKR